MHTFTQPELKDRIYAFLKTQKEAVTTKALMNQPEIGSASLQAVQEALQELVEERLVLTTVLGYFAEINTRNKPRRRLDQGMKELRKWPIALLVGPLVSLYRTFVLRNLWNWFAAEAFHLPEISFWLMYGVVLIIGVFSSDHSKLDQEQNFKILTTLLDACVPEDKREWVSEELENLQSSIWIDFGFMSFAKILDTTWVLVIGWVVHTFLL